MEDEANGYEYQYASFYLEEEDIFSLENREAGKR